MPQAAARLGMTEAAVRGRIKRGTLRSERGSGTVHVVLEGDEPPISRDEPGGEPADQSERIEDLREQVAYLREQLDREREARTEERRRHDTIIAQLSAATAEQARTIRAIEGPSEGPGDAETVEEAPEPRPDAPGPKTATESPPADDTRRPWWRRVFGG